MAHLIAAGWRGLWGELLSVVLGARRAGIDCDPRSLDQLRRLVTYVDAFSQSAAIRDAKDPAAVRKLVRQALADFESEFVQPSWTRRAALVNRYRQGELAADDLPRDILTVLLVHRDDARLELADDGRIVREVATYLQGGYVVSQGGTATSSQTLINTLDLLFPIGELDPEVWLRIVNDRVFAQRCIHETLRLRSTTPRMRRRAEKTTVVARQDIAKDALVILDAARGNLDRRVFGDDADAFNPDRPLPESVPRWASPLAPDPTSVPVVP